VWWRDKKRKERGVVVGPGGAKGPEERRKKRAKNNEGSKGSNCKSEKLLRGITSEEEKSGGAGTQTGEAVVHGGRQKMACRAKGEFMKAKKKHRKGGEKPAVGRGKNSGGVRGAKVMEVGCGGKTAVKRTNRRRRSWGAEKRKGQDVFQGGRRAGGKSKHRTSGQESHAKGTDPKKALQRWLKLEA